MPYVFVYKYQNIGVDFRVIYANVYMYFKKKLLTYRVSFLFFLYLDTFFTIV